jgi:endonuclease/exonuclease/phosphatase family metal-dependent hydrolase
MKPWLLAASLAFAFSSVQGQDRIRVGAWNIETLGSPDRRDYRRKSPANGYGVARKPRELADRIEALRLDVLALSEIDDTDDGGGPATNEVLNEAFRILNRRGGNDWTYELFPKRIRRHSFQHTGLAWNRQRVQAVGRRFRIPVTDVTSRRYFEWDRHPHAMKFTRGRGRTDFVVIPIHMKAGRNDKAVKQRRSEAEALVRELSEIRNHFRDQDIILIGDFNMRRRTEPAGRVYRKKGDLFDLNYYDRPTHIGDLPFDRCYIPRAQRQNEFAGVTQVWIAAPPPAAQRRFRRQLSDHWPIVLEFSEQADDD